MVNMTPRLSEVYVDVGSLGPVRLFFLQYRARN
jgi:hypothetical protein